MDFEGRGVDTLAVGHGHHQGHVAAMGPWEGQRIAGHGHRHPVLAQAHHRENAVHRCWAAFAAAEAAFYFPLWKRRPRRQPAATD